MPVLESLRTRWTLAKWQQFFDDLYAEQNAKRRPLETFSRLVEMSSGVARGVRDNDKDILGKFAPRTLAWLLGLSSQLQVTLESAVWENYPVHPVFPGKA